MLKKPARVVEEESKNADGAAAPKKKITAVEIRLKSDFSKYQNLPHVKLTFPEANT